MTTFPSLNLRTLKTFVPFLFLLPLLVPSAGFAEKCPEGSVYASCAAGWEVATHTIPTRLAPGGVGIVEVDVFNVGAGIPTRPLTVTDVLPPGVTATNAGELVGGIGDVNANTGTALGIYNFEEVRTKLGIEHGFWQCAGAAVVTCTLDPSRGFPAAGAGAGAGFAMEIAIAVKVAPGAERSVPNRVTVAGGGAPAPASASQAVTLSSALPGFGFSNSDAWFSNADGTIDTRAGSHPYAATFAFHLNTALKIQLGETAGGDRTVGGDVTSIEAALPPGLVGDPHAVPQCTRTQFNKLGGPGACPPASQVGILEASVVDGAARLTFVVYNMVPPAGVPAEFAFSFVGVPTFIDASVRSGSDYGINGTVFNVPQRNVTSTILTLWGYPADPSHDYWRSQNKEGCDGVVPVGVESHCQPQAVPGIVPKPFLTLPTACAGPQTFSIRATTWQNPNLRSQLSVLTHDSNGAPTGFTGCDHLNFSPAITLAPDTSFADTPAGLTVEVKPPVGGLSEVQGLSTSDIQNTKVTLPAGVVINPGQAAGLQACQSGHDGLTTESEIAEGRENNGPPSCPAASKVGTVSIETPLLTQRLDGNVYVLQSNPPNLQLLVAASAEGVNVKLVGNVHLDESTGQLVSTFSGTPQLPFTNFKLAFSGGAQAALDTPTQCGTYTSSADFTPWSSPFIGDFLEQSSFAITSGPGGAPCPSSPLPFSPQMIAGSTTDQAGGYTDFSLLLTRPDDQQRITGLQFKTPEGLLGMISRVQLCTNAQAEANACPEASKIGHTVVASGPGPYPLVVPEPGQPPAPIYLTESYGGAPYGLSIVVPLHVGPFTLPTQRVRARIEVDPLTARLTVTTDPLPQTISGVPADLRTINAVVDKPEFMFNPTGCSPRSFSGTASGAEGGQAPLESHFQMGSCRALLFKPDFKVSTSSHTSRAGGASLGVRIVYPTGNLGANQASSQSNIQSVKVELPKRLPSRLTTLQKACTAAQFNANPAGCPADSIVGHATAVTPVLPVPVSGPAYFVSNGSEAFPNLIIVLQGYGITVHLVGDTFISKDGITSSTFKAVPDVPIASFELRLPQGPFSALAANGNLCKGELLMPTDFVAQNGAEVHQKTKIQVTGCAKKKKAKRSRRAARHARRRG